MSSAHQPPEPNDGFDVLEISDCRFPGQVSRSLAAEIAVQSSSGWATAVRHVNGPLVARVRGFHPELAEDIRAGEARLALGSDPIEARLTIVRHPALLEHCASQLPPIATDHVVVVASVSPLRGDGTEIYDPTIVEAVARARFGRAPIWAATTSTVQQDLLERVPDARVIDDWFHPARHEEMDPARHRARLSVFLGPPPRSQEAVTRASSDRPRALFLTSNGAGMGHLTRLLAYARRATGSLEPHFLSLSQAVGVVGAYQMPFEYLPSSGASGLAPRDWNAIFVSRVRETIERIDPRLVVFDGTYPYAGISKIRQANPNPFWVWSRRGMWKAEHNGEKARAQVQKQSWFDAVLEPGDFAQSYDRGMTVGQPAHRVGPVTLLDSDELAGRTSARQALGLPLDQPLALLSLGAGNINDTSGDVGAATEALRKLGVGICMTQSQIGGAGPMPDDVFKVSHFPLSEYIKAFDVAISAAGYNSFHEFLRFGVPTLLVANTQTSLDDQAARARFAADNGLAHAVEAVRVDEAVDLLSDLLTNGQAMVERMRDRDPGNGAIEGAQVLRRMVLGNQPVVSV